MPRVRSSASSSASRRLLPRPARPSPMADDRDAPVDPLFSGPRWTRPIRPVHWIGGARVIQMVLHRTNAWDALRRRDNREALCLVRSNSPDMHHAVRYDGVDQTAAGPGLLTQFPVECQADGFVVGGNRG